MVAAAARKKVPFRGPNEHGRTVIRWKYPDEMTDEERELAADYAEKQRAKRAEGMQMPREQFAAAGAPPSRYQRQIQQFEERAAQLEQQANMSADNNRYGRLLNDASQFRLAAELLREAELVEPGADVTFGYAPRYGMSTRLPPAVSGWEAFEPIRIPYHTYRTNDPVRIAWLRRLIRERADDNLCELEAHDLDAAVSPSGELMGWFPRKIVQDMRSSGGARKLGS